MHPFGVTLRGEDPRGRELEDLPEQRTSRGIRRDVGDDPHAVRRVAVRV